MHPSGIPWRLASARAKDIEKIPHAVMKAMSGPGELGLRLTAYDYFAGKSRRDGLEAALAAGYRDLAVRLLVSDDPAEVGSLLKTAGVAPSYSQGEMQQMLRAGQAFKLTDGRIIPGRDSRDVRYAVTIAQGGAGRRTPEDSAGFRNWLQRRARTLGVTLPADWGRPSAPAVSSPATRQSQPMPGNVPAGKSAAAAGALAKSTARSVDVYTPALNQLAAAPSLADGLTQLLLAGGLGQVQHEVGEVAKAAARLGSGEGARLRRKAEVVSDPQERKAYLELAAQAEQAGAR